jgi:K(+)-stimulated pyrophosphate-energized sodium pump
VVKFSYGQDANLAVRISVAAIAIVTIVGAVYISKRRGIAVGDEDDKGGSESARRSADPAVVS